jgi:hypothetical protein
MRSHLSKAVLAATLMAIAPSMVLAASSGFLGRAGLGAAVISQSPGNYQFTQIDKGVLNGQLLSRLDQSRNNDRLFLIQQHDEINQAFSDVAEKQYKNLQQLSLRSTNQPVTYFDYITLTQAYFVKRLEIKQMIESLQKIPDAISTSANSAAAGDVTVTLQGQLQLNLSALVKPMNDQLDILDAAAQGLTFNVSLPNGVIQQVTNINADGIDKSNLISQAFLDQLILDINQSKAMVLDTATKRIISNINLQTKTQIVAYLSNQGSAERWRHFTKQDLYSQSELRDLTEAFWLRSFVRAKYGVGVGSLAVNFKRKGLNLDRMFSPDNLDLVINPVGTNIADLNTLGAQMREAVKFYDGQANLDGNPLNLVAWTIARVKGNWNLANANVIAIKLLAADLLEEQMILQGGGLRATHQHYKDRYGVNPAMKDYFNKLQCNYDGGCNNDDGLQDIGIADSSSMRGIYASEKPVLDNMLARQEIADRKQQAYSNLVSSFQTLKNAQKRTSSLLN